VSTICHSTTEDTMSLVFKCIALKYNSLKCLQKVMTYTKLHLDSLESVQSEMRAAFALVYDSSTPLDACMILIVVSHLNRSTRSPIQVWRPRNYFYRDIYGESVVVQWLTTILSSALKASYQCGQESGPGWSRSERESRKS
jgi:hypothetical protein